MASDLYPSKRYQYVNDVTGATTQYTGILGSGTSVNENPLAVDTLIQWAKNQYINGLILYGLSGAPFRSSGDTTFSAAGKAKIRDFIARCNAEGIEVHAVSSFTSVSFSECLIEYNQTVNANEKFSGVFTENEFWHDTVSDPGTKQNLIDMIDIISQVKSDLNAEGIFIYGYLGFTHNAGYQYILDATPITYDEVTHLCDEGALDYFCFHVYARIPNYSYCRERLRQVTAGTNCLFIKSDETPDNNASGSFDTSDYYFEGWFMEGRDTSITPGVPNDPPPVIYPRKNDVDAYNYITHAVTSPLPAQSGTAPVYYDDDTDVGAVGANVLGIVTFAWRYTHPLNYAPGTPPAPVPSGLVSWFGTPSVREQLLEQILYTLISSPLANPTPLPTDYSALNSVTDILLFNILVSLAGGSGGGGGVNPVPIDITLAQAVQKNIDNDWTNGAFYRIVDPPAPLASFTAQALDNIEVGEVRLNVQGLATVFNYDSTVYHYMVVCGWDFSNYLSIGALYLYDPINNIEIWQSDSFGSNAAFYIQWDAGYTLDVVLSNVIVVDTNYDLHIQQSSLFNTSISYGDFPDSSSINGCNAYGATIEFYTGDVALNSCNLLQGSYLKVYGNYLSVSLDEYATLTDSDTSNPDINNIKIGNLSIFDLAGFEANNVIIGTNINLILFDDASNNFCDGENSNFRIDIDLSEASVYDSMTQALLVFYDYYGIIVLNNDTGGDVDIISLPSPTAIYNTKQVFAYSDVSSNLINFKTGGNLRFPSVPAIVSPVVLAQTPDQVSIQSDYFTSAFRVLPDATFIT